MQFLLQLALHCEKERRTTSDTRLAIRLAHRRTLRTIAPRQASTQSEWQDRA